MKVIILAAGQGTRLRPLTDDKPKCMVEVNGQSILDRQIDTMHSCGVKDEDLVVVAGYRGDILQKKFQNTQTHVLINGQYETTNMVYSLMCAKKWMEKDDDILISYGDIIYHDSVLCKILQSEADISVVVDDDWFSYWSERCDNPLDDAETLMYNESGYLTEIGQKTTDLNKVQSQYIGLIRFKRDGLNAMLTLAKEAEIRSGRGTRLWGTGRSYQKMYMTDLLQGLIENGNQLKAVHIKRGWFEIDNAEDLKIAERNFF